MKLRARCQLLGDYGMVSYGDVFEAPDSVARVLLKAGNAERADSPTVLYETQVLTPQETPEVRPERPFVTCVCLTKNRRQWLPLAMQCFLRQTYPNRELLIVADGERVEDLLPPAPAAQIRLVHLRDSFPIGHKRNIGCERALGSVICHWDDDDWSDAGRIADQIERLDEHCDVTGYHSMYFTDGQKWWSYKGPPNYAIGTSLCYRRSWWAAHPFDPIQVGEDNAFVFAAAAAGRLIVVPANGMMYATTHAENSSPRIYGSNWTLVTA